VWAGEQQPLPTNTPERYCRWLNIYSKQEEAMKSLYDDPERIAAAQKTIPDHEVRALQKVCCKEVFQDGPDQPAFLRIWCRNPYGWEPPAMDDNTTVVMRKTISIPLELPPDQKGAAELAAELGRKLGKLMPLPAAISVTSEIWMSTQNEIRPTLMRASQDPARLTGIWVGTVSLDGRGIYTIIEPEVSEGKWTRIISEATYEDNCALHLFMGEVFREWTSTRQTLLARKLSELAPEQKMQLMGWARDGQEEEMTKFMDQLDMESIDESEDDSTD
jgi:hypothetical protein